MIVTGLILSWIVLRYAGTDIQFIGDDWLSDWRTWVAQRVSPAIGDTIALVVLVVAPGALVALLLELFGHWLFGLVGFLGSLAMLFYSCGRQDYDTMMLTDPVDSGPANPEHPTAISTRETESRQNRAYASCDRWFNTAFWFVVFGPVGALLYRCTSILSQAAKTEDSSEAEMELQAGAHSLLGWLDWVPVRIWSACFLLVGDFSKGFAAYRKQWLSTEAHARFIDSVSLAAAGVDLSAGAVTVQEDQALRDDLLALNDRVMWVVLFLMLILALL